MALVNKTQVVVESVVNRRWLRLHMLSQSYDEAIWPIAPVNGKAWHIKLLHVSENIDDAIAVESASLTNLGRGTISDDDVARIKAFAAIQFDGIDPSPEPQLVVPGETQENSDAN